MTWDEIAARTARDGVTTVSDLIDTGVPSSTISARCRAGGPWQRVLPGVVLLARGDPGPRQRVRAALAYAGPGAVLTGLHAAAAHGLRQVPPGDEVHLLVPHERRRRGAGFAVVERTRRMPDPVPGALPLAPLERAVLDAARRTSDRRTVCALLADAVQRRRTTPARLLAELGSGSARGSALPRLVLREDVGEGVHSVAEADAHRLLRRSRLPQPQWNPALRGTDGRLVGYPDAWFDDVALAWQIDSYAWHLSPREYAQSLDRDAVLVAEGVVVVRTAPADLRKRSARVLSQLERAHARAQQRPRPPVRATPRGGLLRDRPEVVERGAPSTT